MKVSFMLVNVLKNLMVEKPTLKWNWRPFWVFTGYLKITSNLEAKCRWIGFGKFLKENLIAYLMKIENIKITSFSFDNFPKPTYRYFASRFEVFYVPANSNFRSSKKKTLDIKFLTSTQYFISVLSANFQSIQKPNNLMNFS